MPILTKDRCLVCGGDNVSVFCSCNRTYMEKYLKVMDSIDLVNLLEECLTGPLPEEKQLRLTIMNILIQREA